MDSLLKAELNFQLEDSVFWTDSTSVLKYLNNVKVRADFLKNSRQLESPTFLWKHEEDWPKTVLEVSVDSNDQVQVTP